MTLKRRYGLLPSQQGTSYRPFWPTISLTLYRGEATVVVHIGVGVWLGDCFCSYYMGLYVNQTLALSCREPLTLAGLDIVQSVLMELVLREDLLSASQNRKTNNVHHDEGRNPVVMKLHVACTV